MPHGSPASAYLRGIFVLLSMTVGGEALAHRPTALPVPTDWMAPCEFSPFLTRDGRGFSDSGPQSSVLGAPVPDNPSPFSSSTTGFRGTPGLADHGADRRHTNGQRKDDIQGHRKRDPWRTLSPEQRRTLEERRRRFEQLSPQQQQRLLEARERFLHLPPEERAKLREQWRELPPEERRRWRNTAPDYQH